MKKIIGILVIILLIGTILIPTTNSILLFEDKYLDENNEISLSGNTELKWMITGDGIRCLRSYWIHVPPSYNGSKSVPPVLVFHPNLYFN